MNRAPKLQKAKKSTPKKVQKAPKRALNTKKKTKQQQQQQHSMVNNIQPLSFQPTSQQSSLFAPRRQFSTLPTTTFTTPIFTAPTFLTTTPSRAFATTKLMNQQMKMFKKLSHPTNFTATTSTLPSFTLNLTNKRFFAAADTIADNSVVVPPELEKKYKRLMFQATQRGWLELDLIFTAYVATYKAKLMNEESLDYLTQVCDCDNSDLVRWFVEGRPLPDEWKSNPIMVDMLDYALLPSKPWYPKAGNQ